MADCAIIALFGGATEADQIKIPYQRLEFYYGGIRFCSRGMFARLLATQDLRYEQITQLVVLTMTATTGARSRGIRLRTADGSEFLYFFARPATVPYCRSYSDTTALFLTCDEASV